MITFVIQENELLISMIRNWSFFFSLMNDARDTHVQPTLIYSIIPGKDLIIHTLKKKLSGSIIGLAGGNWNRENGFTNPYTVIIVILVPLNTIHWTATFWCDPYFRVTLDNLWKEKVTPKKHSLIKISYLV